MEDHKLQAIERAQKKLQEAKRHAGPSPRDGACFINRDGASEAAAAVIRADLELFDLDPPAPWVVQTTPEWGEFEKKEQNLVTALAAVQAAVTHLPEVPKEAHNWDFPVPDTTSKNLVRIDGHFVLRYLRSAGAYAAYEHRIADVRRSRDQLLSSPVERLPVGWVANPNLICDKRAKFNIEQQARAVASLAAAAAVDKAAYEAAVARIRKWGESTFYPLYGALCRAYGTNEEEDAIPSEDLQHLFNVANAAAEDWRYYVISRMTYVITTRTRNTDLEFVVRSGRPLHQQEHLIW